MVKKLPAYKYDSKKLINHNVSINTKIHKRYKFIFLFLNVLIIISAFVTLVLTTFIISTMFWTGWPFWYFAYTLSASAAVSFITACLNFFFIKERYTKAKLINDKIQVELVLYNNKIGLYAKGDVEYWLTVNIYAICNNDYAIREVENAQK